jgi:hypothetical protein
LSKLIVGLRLAADTVRRRPYLLRFSWRHKVVHGALGSDSQHFPSLANPVRRGMTFSRARARSSVLSDMPLAFAFSSRRVAATSPSASSRRRKAMAWSIRFGCFRFWPIDFTLGGADRSGVLRPRTSDRLATGASRPGLRSSSWSALGCRSTHSRSAIRCIVGWLGLACGREKCCSRQVLRIFSSTQLNNASPLPL